MKIKGKRIRTPKNYLIGILSNKEFYIGIESSEVDSAKITHIGFSNSLNIGEQVLPSSIGKVSDFNANGGFEKLMDLPKETVYREVEMTDWHGYTHFVDVPYKRYQREPIPAPSIELTIIENNGKKIIVSPKLNNNKSSEFQSKHIINLFLELFGECEVLKEDLTPSFKNIKRLNWNVLPQGKYPWSELKDKVGEIVSKYNYSKEKKEKIERRTSLINQYSPDFIAIGNAGFHGYMIFGFPNKNIYVLESVHFGNATYVFGNNWEELSKLSKKEILDGNLHTNRFVHRNMWEREIKNLLK